MKPIHFGTISFLVSTKCTHVAEALPQNALCLHILRAHSIEGAAGSAIERGFAARELLPSRLAGITFSKKYH